MKFASLSYLPPALQRSQGTIYESSSMRSPPPSLPPFLRSHPFQPPHPAALPPFVPLDRSAAPGREFRDASLNCAAKKFTHRLGCQPWSLLEGKEETLGGKRSKRMLVAWGFFSPSASTLFPRFKDGSLPRLALPRMDPLDDGFWIAAQSLPHIPIGLHFLSLLRRALIHLSLFGLLYYAILLILFNSLWAPVEPFVKKSREIL